MRNNQQLSRYLQETKLKLAVGEQTRIPIRVVTDGVTEQKQLLLFGNELSGSESVPADDSRADDEVNRLKRRRSATTSDEGVATALLSVVYASTSVAGEFFHRCSTDDALATVRADPPLRREVE